MKLRYPFRGGTAELSPELFEEIRTLASEGGGHVLHGGVYGWSSVEIIDDGDLAVTRRRLMILGHEPEKYLVTAAEFLAGIGAGGESESGA
jgi:hypothetical protein